MFKNLGLNAGKMAVALLISGYLIYCLMHGNDWHLVDSADLIIHEAGHTIMRFFGEFIYILGGSLFQILIPFIFAVYFYHNEDYSSASLVAAWLGYNLVNLSVYISDAIAMNLELLGGDSAIHDWNYLLSHVHLLSHTSVIGSLANGLGMTIVTLSIISAFYYCREESQQNI